MKQLLLGDEAIAQGAIDAGISGIYAYPGTPSTEIMEYIQKSEPGNNGSIHCKWSTNEKTAVEEALGMSYAGKRSIVCMKHVGLNVAADAFINAAMTGVNGGMIVVSADDPSMHSSQNEQDSRFYGKFAMVPVLEPSNQQEAYDMVRYGFDLSEKLQTPVLFRITTRLAHSRTGLEVKAPRKQNVLRMPQNTNQFILLPANARVRNKRLINLQNDFILETENNNNVSYFDGADKSRGIIACGLAYNYLMESYAGDGCPFPVVKICQYPFSVKHIQTLMHTCKEILVLEEGFPFVEEQLRGLIETGTKIKGRMTGEVPRDGELNPTIVAKALGKETSSAFQVPTVVVNRPPALCKGCSHIDMYNAVVEATSSMLGHRVFSDIGCYTLGALPPYNAIHTCVDMGASITMAKGAADAGVWPAIAVIGDSTFTHSGMTGLLDAILENTDITVIISDNSTTGMTGGQPSAATNRLEQICKGLGVDPAHILTIVPLKKNHEENVQIMRNEINYEGVSVIISQRECIQTSARKHRN
ncbi:MAG TPA: thiamine pyrophosphate-dependent enzyme [Bacteroidales bacterium]|nr:thiamine pyrophosphate-dependent enzyme [Bacteroidales bacterium]